MMGAQKGDPFLTYLIQFMTNLEKGHFSEQTEFKGDVEYECLQQHYDQKLTMIDGKYIGIKDVYDKPLGIEDWMSDSFLNVEISLYGIYVPREEILRRNKFQWFAILPIQDVLNTTTILSKYFNSSLSHQTKKELSLSCI